LRIWAALQNAGVEMGYVIPPTDEKPIATNCDLITPFAYSLPKIWDKRHALLYSQDYNQKQLSDPLQDVIFTKQDLIAHGINISATETMCEQRLANQKQHAEQAQLVIDAELNAIKSHLSKARTLDEELEKLEALIKNINDDTALVNVLKQHQDLLKNIASLYPRQDNSRMTMYLWMADFSVWEDLLTETNQNILHGKAACFRDSLEKIRATFHHRKEHGEAIKNIIADFQCKAVANETSPFVAEIKQKLNNAGIMPEDLTLMVLANPVQMQLIYRKLHHVINEEKSVAREQQRLTVAFQRQRQDLLVAIEKKINCWDINPFLRNYGPKREALKALKSKIVESHHGDKNFSALIKEWEAQNQAAIKSHRNRFFSENRNNVPTSTELFVNEIKATYKHLKI